MNSPDRVVLGISGGVDSAVAAALLFDAGLEVHALAWGRSTGISESASSL